MSPLWQDLWNTVIVETFFRHHSVVSISEPNISHKSQGSCNNRSTPSRTDFQDLHQPSTSQGIPECRFPWQRCESSNFSFCSNRSSTAVKVRAMWSLPHSKCKVYCQSQPFWNVRHEQKRRRNQRPRNDIYIFPFSFRTSISTMVQRQNSRTHWTSPRNSYTGRRI